MLTLAAIITERIKDIQRIKKIQSKNDEDKQINSIDQKIQKAISQIQKKQSIRITTELTTINDLRSQTLTSEDNIVKFLNASMGVFRTYSPTFEQRFQMKENQSLALKANRLYRQFLSNHANTFHFAHIYSTLKKGIVDVNPVIYLGLIGQWSRGLLAQTIQKQTNSNQTLRLKAQLNRITGNKIAQEKGMDLVLFTRQNFYGYFLPELEEYYKRLEFLDLDLDYLHNIKPMGHKQQLLGRNTNQSLQFIISKANSKIAFLTQRYCDQYRTHFTKKIQKRVRHSSLKNHRPNKFKMIDPNIQQRSIDQYKIEQDLLLNLNRSPNNKAKKVQVKACKKIQFPLIPGINNINKISGISPSKVKKPIKFKTQKQQSVSPSNHQKSNTLLKQNRLSHQVKLELILAENEYNNRNRHQSLVRKLRHKGFMNERQKTEIGSSNNLNYKIFEMNGQQNHFLFQKLK